MANRTQQTVLRGVVLANGFGVIVAGTSECANRLYDFDWQAFAFAPNLTAVRTALEWGMLDDAPEEVERQTPMMTDNKELGLLAHQLTVALGKVERGEIEE